MVIIDSQVHAYERDHPGRPWAGVLTGPAEVTGDDMVAAMDAVGVDGAVLVSPFTMYGYDASYALEVHRKYPGRFGLVKPVDPSDPGVAESIADWAATTGTIGIRLMMNREHSVILRSLAKIICPFLFLLCYDWRYAQSNKRGDCSKVYHFEAALG